MFLALAEQSPCKKMQKYNSGVVNKMDALLGKERFLGKVSSVRATQGSLCIQHVFPEKTVQISDTRTVRSLL